MKCLSAALVVLVVLPLTAQSQARRVRIGVLGIFHPQELTLVAVDTNELLVSAGNQQLFLRPRSECSVLSIRASGSELHLGCGSREFRATELHASGRNQQNAELLLAVPGKLRRRYEGFLDLKSENGELIPVVTMDLETAVASAVSAETLPGTSTEALKAQAVVSRSYLVAGGGRHADFDFCDLTHCQLIQGLPAADSPAAQATLATQNLVLTYEDKTFAAMFTPSCAGHTRTPQEIGLPQNGYPYFSVLCDYCHRYPIRWTRKVSRDDAALLVLRGENGRLDIGRRLGWDAVPSNNFTAEEVDGGVRLQGVGHGHGLGLCERGAQAMARQGSGFRAILGHYFPNTRLRDLASAK